MWELLITAILGLYQTKQPVLPPQKQVLEIKSEVIEVKKESIDVREQAIKLFLEKYHSPLSDVADEFVEFGDLYRIDPYLLVAVSGAESTFGRANLCAAYNPFGFGNPCISFENYREAIKSVAKTIGSKSAYAQYQSDGRIESLGRVYVGYTSEQWIFNVHTFINKLKETEGNL